MDYFGGETVSRTEEEVRVKAPKKVKTGDTEERGKSGDELTIDCVWKLCNMGIEYGVVEEDWKTGAILPLYKGIKNITE